MGETSKTCATGATRSSRFEVPNTSAFSLQTVSPFPPVSRVSPMPLIKTAAITLKSRKWGDADRIVTFYTKEMGKVRGVARGLVG